MLKITIKLNGIIVKYTQFTVVGLDTTNSKLIVPIITSQPCRVFFYWIGPSSSFAIYAPNKTRISGTPISAIANGTTSFNIDLNMMGTWYVAVQHNIFYTDSMKNITVKVTTQSDSQCLNPCILKGSDIQLSPGSTS